MKVLVVEDNVYQKKLMCNILSKLGYEVMAASDGVEMLEIILSDSDIGLVITDIDMPYLDGIAAANIAKRHVCDRVIPIIAVTGLSDYKEIEKVALESFDAVIQKPVDISTLTRLINLKLNLFLGESNDKD